MLFGLFTFDIFVVATGIAANLLLVNGIDSVKKKNWTMMIIGPFLCPKMDIKLIINCKSAH